MIAISLTVDEQRFSAQVAPGSTLRSFLDAAGFLGEGCSVVTDGARALSLDLELAMRWQGATLRTEVPAEMLQETSALTPEQLLAVAEKR